MAHSVRMNPAEALLVVAVFAVPVLLGVGAAMLRRPWWWAAVAAAVIALVAMVAPEPEPGEPRLAAGDIGFVVVVLAFVVALVWVGNLLGRRFARDRSA